MGNPPFIALQNKFIMGYREELPCAPTHSKITLQGTFGFLIYREFPDLGEEKDNDPIFNVIFLGPKVTLYLLYFSSVS